MKIISIAHELGQKEVAIELYRKGIRELEYGIAVDCWGGRGEVWERAQRLHDKMQTNLSMARDRLHFLASGQKLIVINKRGNNSLVNKSQTLPRSMGSRAATTSEPSRHQRLPIKPATTPPVIRRQFSVSIRIQTHNIDQTLGNFIFMDFGTIFR